ncbi:5-methyltetrahydropteroyltriglutamate--homocysteine methyltransferase-like isoform X2 [Panonychus citri]|uniref:5-methyltetrahydropteroyltriglutamate-- homocysteine methyltransferase-like isoform X2 n=1 Tax=Panonychus citri TaxID=50023 RepID=UPI00230767D0|nr:5-methyltetrahydropteroyltriglutamate--homocysteine methyltransferase-like isoform X2 [Panonychus citri]
MAKLLISNLGYPRIGFSRQWKKCLESFWSGSLGQEQFLTEMKNLRLAILQNQKDLGVDLIPVNDFTFYDQVLDMATMFNIVPKRYKHDPSGPVDLSTYFAMARGTQESIACEMTKWFNTNYHYIVPEYESGVQLRLTQNRPLEAFVEAKEQLNIIGKPVIIGPFSFAKFTKGEYGTISNYVHQLVPLYVEMLKGLEKELCEWVQMDEPFLVVGITSEEMKLVELVYQELKVSVPNLKIMLQTYFDSLENYEEIIKLPVAGIGLDFVHGYENNLKNLEKINLPDEKVLGVGLINGRNIWRCDLMEKYKFLQKILQLRPADKIWIQPSCSLQFTPVSAKGETKLAPFLRNAIAYSDEKLTELKHLAVAFNEGADHVSAAFNESTNALKDLESERQKIKVNVDLENLTAIGIERSHSFESRFDQQAANLLLPRLPTTTIGSFPQTTEVRSARNKWKKGTLSNEDYEKFICQQIEKWIRIQEEIGIDVLVHGEFERTDMVEYFGEKLVGFAFTSNGWVQSYGSRCVKPPIIYGDVSFKEPMTVKETVYAQSLTKKPVKGMITGPVTILNWSFVRDDIPRSNVSYQIALALRDEVLALEAAGIKLVQVDEPAVREGLPLKKSDWSDYLDWAVKSFRLATCKVKPETQIHTHMCYCEFQDIIQSILDLDADVISIETSRSHGEMIAVFEKFRYSKGIGLGVYDIHSPRIPSKEEMSDILNRGLKVVDPKLFWVNPDCGLKTRNEGETVAALKNMVEAAKEVRTRLT